MNKEFEPKKKALESLLTITEGLGFRFILGEGVRFPHEYDVLNVFRRHKNNLSEVEVIRDKDRLSKYGSFDEGNTNGIVKAIANHLGVKNEFAHDKIYEMRTETFEKVLDLRIKEPLFSFSSFNIDSMTVSYGNKGGLYKIILQLGNSSDGKSSTTKLELFDFKKIEPFVTREKGMVE